MSTTAMMILVPFDRGRPVMKSTLIEFHKALGIFNETKSLGGLQFTGLFLLQELQALNYVATCGFIRKS